MRLRTRGAPLKHDFEWRWPALYEATAFADPEPIPKNRLGATPLGIMDWDFNDARTRTFSPADVARVRKSLRARVPRDPSVTELSREHLVEVLLHAVLRHAAAHLSQADIEASLREVSDPATDDDAHRLDRLVPTPPKGHLCESHDGFATVAIHTRVLFAEAELDEYLGCTPAPAPLALQAFDTHTFPYPLLFYPGELAAEVLALRGISPDDWRRLWWRNRETLGQPRELEPEPRLKVIRELFSGRYSGSLKRVLSHGEEVPPGAKETMGIGRSIFVDEPVELLMLVEDVDRLLAGVATWREQAREILRHKPHIGPADIEPLLDFQGKAPSHKRIGNVLWELRTELGIESSRSRRGKRGKAPGSARKHSGKSRPRGREKRDGTS